MDLDSDYSDYSDHEDDATSRSQNRDEEEMMKFQNSSKDNISWTSCISGDEYRGSGEGLGIGAASYKHAQHHGKYSQHCHKTKRQVLGSDQIRPPRL